MKLPSISYIVRNAAGTYLRFPAAILVAAVGSIAAVILASHEETPSAQWLMSICYACSLGIPLLMTTVLVAERRKWNSFVLQLGGLLVVAGYWLTLPQDFMLAPFLFTYRHIILFASVHLLVAFAPFLGDRETSGFWQYNKTLFLRILVSGLFSQVLWCGLAVALLALNQLFGMKIPGDRYFQLWIIIFGIFNTWFFLAGVPEHLEPSATGSAYPKGLKVFTQYVLLPLVAVYLLILYAYMGKIIIEWSWPEGWVSRLILGFSITGILSLLLVHPLKDLEEHRWIRIIWKWYYIVLVPLVALLLLATFRRISEYGITESRYVGIVLALWLAGITLYFIFSRQKSIKAIPLSLCVIGCGIAWGPWGAFRVSEQSQLQHLEGLLVRNGMLVDGTVRKPAARISEKDVREVNSVVRYLVESHGTGGLQPWFTNRLDTLGSLTGGRWAYRHDQADRIIALMGVDVGTGPRAVPRDFVTPMTSTSVEGYTYLANVGVTNATYDIAGHGSIVVETCLDSLCVVVREVGPHPERVEVDLRPLCPHLRSPDVRGAGRPISSEDMTAEASGAHLKLKVVLSRLRCPQEDEPVDLSNVSGIVLIGFRQQ